MINMPPSGGFIFTHKFKFNKEDIICKFTD